MVQHASVEKLTTWKAPLLLCVPLSSEMPLLTEGRVTEGSANKISKQYHSYGSPPGKRGVKEDTNLSQSDNSITYIAESISPQPSGSSVLPQANPVPGYATDTFSHYGTSTRPQHYRPLRCTGI